MSLYIVIKLLILNLVPNCVMRMRYESYVHRLVGITKAKIVPKGFGINVEEEHGVYGFLNVVAHMTIGVDLEANVM